MFRHFNRKLIYSDIILQPIEEIPLLPIPVEKIPNELGIGRPSDIKKSGNWLISFTSSFQKSLSSIGDKKRETIRINPIAIENMDDETDLCVGEDFIYGAIPPNFLKEAREMKREWLQHLISEFEACGYIAYSEKSLWGSSNLFQEILLKNSE